MAQAPIDVRQISLTEKVESPVLKEQTESEDLQSFFRLLRIDVRCPEKQVAEAVAIATASPLWFWESARDRMLEFVEYDRSKARERAVYLWEGGNPDDLVQDNLSFSLGEVSPPQPARLAFFAMLDSLAVLSWRSLPAESRAKWEAEVESWAGVDGGLISELSLKAQVHRLWNVAWRWAGHREYEWMEHQLSYVAVTVREKARTALIDLIPEACSTSALWEPIRFGLRQDARALYSRLEAEILNAEPNSARNVTIRRDRQVKLGEVFARFSGVCARCAASGESCCSRDIPHYYFSRADLSYLKGANAGLPPFDEQAASGNYCIFIGPEGCRFPADLRPAVCLSHTCDAIYHELSPKEKSLLTRFELRRLMTMRDVD